MQTKCKSGKWTAVQAAIECTATATVALGLGSTWWIPGNFLREWRGFIESSRNEKLHFVAFDHQRAKMIFSKTRGKWQRNFLVESKQEILKFCRFSRIARKFRWNKYQKVLIWISANQFLNGVTSCKTEHKNYCSWLQSELHRVRQCFSNVWSF